MNDKPNYYAIIPANVRYDEKLSASEKLMYGEITALSNKHGYCTARNSYFTNLYHVNDRTVRRWINNLKNRGYVKVGLPKKDGKTQRKIYISDGYVGGTKMSDPPGQKCPTPQDKNVPHNNTSMNITRINNIYSQAQLDDGHSETIKEIINYLNEKADKNYKNSAYAKKHIKARLNEGYELDDFKKVIDNKVADWKGDSNFDKFLRPQTLFSNKFESYLNETPAIDQSKEDIYEYTKDLGW